MKQIVQDLKAGDTILLEVPRPQCGSTSVLVRAERSLVSLGTERMLVSFGQANLLDKARQQPEKVKEVLAKMQSDGIQPTVEAVFRKLGAPLPLGYSMAGTVIEVGHQVTEFRPGDRVVCNGPHAEFVSSPVNLTARIPDGVSFEEASFTVVGAIALQGIRLVQPTLGETVAVIGLGLIGLMTAQLLKANGCRVVGFDLDPDKLKLAEAFGVTAVDSGTQDPVRFMESFTQGIGADAVIITASTKSNAVIKQSAQMSRKRGRIVLVGVIGLQLDRSDFYEKELSFQVSCSYGPGRYDEHYEKRGLDYPLPFVRWTEKRNFEAILEAIRTGAIDVNSLITERVPLEDYNSIYGNISSSRSIASIISYPEATEESVSASTHTIRISTHESPAGKGIMALIGAGNFTQAMIMPALKKVGAQVKYVVSSTGLSSTTLAEKYKVPFSTTDLDSVLRDSDLHGVVITTRHDAHAWMTIKALQSGKHVFVEKPLALSIEDLNEISKAVQESGKTVTVGFNRRFSPHARKMKSLLGEKPGPMNIIATMNAGYIPPDVWVHDMHTGGGRILGEACHYIDLLTYLTGSKVESVSMQALGADPKVHTDNASIHLKFENGSLGVINYFANGHKSYSKERVEVYYQGKNLILDNFRKLEGYGFKGVHWWSNTLLKTPQDKGHFEQFKLLNERWKSGGAVLIPYDELENTTRATLAALESLSTGGVVKL